MIRINNTEYVHFLQQADALRRSGSLCDALISVKSQTFRAHRLVLACASRRLAQQLALGDLNDPVHCTLECFSPHTFQQVLDFTYTQTLEVSVDDLHLLLRAAQLLEMQPLEDQCRMQLHKLRCSAREEDEKREIIHLKEEKESPEQTEQKLNESPIGKEKLREASTPVEPCNSIVMENISNAAKDSNGAQSPRKKARVSPESRESVITWPAGSRTPLSSPWAFPNMWKSVRTLRQLAENYPSLVPVHPLQSPNQSSLTHPFSFTTPHMFPLFGPHFQSSAMGCSDFHSRYMQSLYAGPTGIRDIIKHGPLKRKKSRQRAFTVAFQPSQPSYHDASRACTEKVKDCQHRSTGLLDDPALRESAPTPSGCHFSGRGVAVQRQSQPQEHRGEKPYQCQHCPKKFSLKHQLDTHHRVHTGEKPFECRSCGQRSRDYSAMIKHLRTHGGALPYQCTVCLEFCSSLVAMQRHVKNHTEQDFPPGWTINSTYMYISHV